MSSDRHERISDLVYAASQRSGEERRAFLDRECREDPTLLQEVRSLLAELDADDIVDPEQLAQGRIMDRLPGATVAEEPPPSIGGYRPASSCPSATPSASG